MTLAVVPYNDTNNMDQYHYVRRHRLFLSLY